MDGEKMNNEPLKFDKRTDTLMEISMAFASITKDLPDLLDADIDSLDWKQYLIELTNEFEEKNRDTDWNEKDFLSEVQSFATERIPDLYEERIGSKYPGRFVLGGKSIFERQKRELPAALLPTGNLAGTLRVPETVAKIVFMDSSDGWRQGFKRLTRFPDDDENIQGQTGVSSYYDQADDTAYIVSESGRFELPEDCAGMFARFKNLRKIEGLERIDASKAKNMKRMFAECPRFTKIDISNWNVSHVTGMEEMFKNCLSLTEFHIYNEPLDRIWDTSKVTSTARMFCGCKSLENVDVAWLDTRSVTDMTSMFEGCESLTKLNLASLPVRSLDDDECWRTENVTTTESMFEGCRSLTELDLSGWDTGSVRYMTNMFKGCSSLESLKSDIFDSNSSLSDWDISNVRDISGMFSGCSSLSDLSLSGWDTGRVTTMTRTFDGCRALTELDLSSWNTTNVTSMSCMFNSCSSLIHLDVSHWDTENVTDMFAMFSSCKSLQDLQLGSFDTSSVTNMVKMFEGCGSLEHIDLSGASCAERLSVTDMFAGCDSLKRVSLPKAPLTAGKLKKTAAAAIAFNDPDKVLSH